MTRQIDDRLTGQELRVDGELRLTRRDEDTVDWHEEGLLRRSHLPPATVHRNLTVVRRGEGWWVVFDHGGDFHRWSPGAWVDHPCGADHYRGLVDLDCLPDGWAITWEVTGPTKDYTMGSDLTRRLVY